MSNRPKPVYPRTVIVRVTPEVAERVEDFRFTERIKSESEAVRRLIDLGLASITKEQGE